MRKKLMRKLKKSKIKECELAPNSKSLVLHFPKYVAQLHSFIPDFFLKKIPFALLNVNFSTLKVLGKFKTHYF